jgi:hypothetical protein
MTHRDRFIATFLIVFSALVGVAIVEVGYYIYQRAFPPFYGWNQIVFLDGSDSIFRNLGHIYTYVPNSHIFSRSIYFYRSSYSTEYLYKFKTNNFGLVQDRDLARGVKSILLLGDSFTEGQGAEPWFRQVAPQIERLNYQPINGGLRATGFLHWWELEQFLSANEIALAKLVIIFISDDVRRPKRNFSESELACLRSISLCLGNETFFRLPPESELANWVAKIRTAREPPHDVSIKGRIRSALPATRAVYGFLLNVARAPPQTELPQIVKERVETVINKMVEKYGRENVLFIHLPQKEELKGTILPNGLLARKLIRDSGARYADGTSLCGLDGSDFWVYDNHPNQRGYSKIAKCVAQIIEPFLTQDR